MKKLALFFFLIILGFPAFAQHHKTEEKKETHYLINVKTKIAGFGGPSLELSSIKGNLASFIGGQGGTILNDLFYLGGYGKGYIGKQELQGTDANFNFFHGE